MGSPEFRIKGYESGADLYLVKPISCKELAAAIANLTCRLNQAASQPQVSQSAIWTLNITGLQLIAPTGIQISLSDRETSFIKLLISQPGQKISRLAACKSLEFTDDDSHDRRMDAMIRRLRKKTKESSGFELPIQTIYGKGYVFSDRATVL